MDQSTYIPNRIWFLGDCHGSFHHVFNALEEASALPEALVFLGDMELRDPYAQLISPIERQGIQVCYIHGNHDTDSLEMARCLFDSNFSAYNLHCKVNEIAGIRVAGLGGVFRSSIWYPRFNTEEPSRFETYEDFVSDLKNRWPKRLREGQAALKTGKKEILHRSSIFPQDWKALAAMSADVLVTHEAPSCHPNGFAAIDRLARCLGVHSAFHGHHHDSLDYQNGTTLRGYNAFGVGLRGIADLSGKLIIPGE